MRVAEREQGLSQHLGSLGRLELAVAVQELPRRAPAHVLHDHVVDAVDGAPVVDGDDVGVRQARRGACLPAEPIDEGLVARERAVQDLDRDLTREHGVVRAEDLAHTPGGDALHDVVAPVEGDESDGLRVLPEAPGGSYSWTWCSSLGGSARSEARPGAILRSEGPKPWRLAQLHRTTSARVSTRSRGHGTRASLTSRTSGSWASGDWWPSSNATGSSSRSTPTRSGASIPRRPGPACGSARRVAGNLEVLLGVVLGGAAVWVVFASSTAWVKGLALILAGGIWAVSVHTPAHWLVGRAIGDPLHGLLPRGTPAAPARTEDRLRHLPPRRPGQPCVVPCLRSDRHQVRAVRSAGVLARLRRALVVGGGPARDRRRPDRHGHHAVGEVQRLEEVPAREGGGARDGTGAEDRSGVSARSRRGGP